MLRQVTHQLFARNEIITPCTAANTRPAGMTLEFRNRSHFFELHCSTALTDWDMDEELKLTTTTDQFVQDEKLNDQYLAQWHYARISRRKIEFLRHDQKSESLVQPNLWMLVNPNLVCPIKYAKRSASVAAGVLPGLPGLPVEPQGPGPGPAESCSVYAPAPSAASPPCCLHLGDEDQTPLLNIPACRQAATRRKQRNTKTRDNKAAPRLGGWPRPPVNYCILIAVALSSSHTGSLNVQQIYNFTREHFPFFQTAPDGWKNTIRHNLCFSNSFRKTPYQLCREGKRKSCLWHLTLDGRRKLRDEIRTLTGNSFRELRRSMSRPDVIQALFEL